MKKEFLMDELSLGMQQELVKQASDEQPSLVKAAECLHAALEILEEQGLQTTADQVLQVLEKIAQRAEPIKKSAKIHSIQQLMEAGITQHDLKEFARGNPRATAKLNLILRKLGLSEHELSKFLGPGNVMSEEQARKAISPNEPGSLLEFKSLAPELMPPAEEAGEALKFMSLAVKKKSKRPGRPDRISDRHTKGLTPEKMVENIKQHGHPMNLANDGNCAVDVPPAFDGNPAKEDLLPGFEEILDFPGLDFDASDDQIMGMEVTDDLEVFDKDIPLEDFEEERD